VKITYPRVMIAISSSFLLWLLWSAYSDEQRSIKLSLRTITTKIDLLSGGLGKLQSENAKFNTDELANLHDISQLVRSNGNVLQELQQDIEVQTSPSPSSLSSK
jgi:hypothetical protein